MSAERRPMLNIGQTNRFCLIHSQRAAATVTRHPEMMADGAKPVPSGVHRPDDAVSAGFQRPWLRNKYRNIIKGLQLLIHLCLHFTCYSAFSQKTWQIFPLLATDSVRWRCLICQYTFKRFSVFKDQMFRT